MADRSKSTARRLSWRVVLGGLAILVLGAPICGGDDESAASTAVLNPAHPRICIESPPNESPFVYTFTRLPIYFDGYTWGIVDRVDMELDEEPLGNARPILGTALDEALAENHCRPLAPGPSADTASGYWQWNLTGIEPGYYEVHAIARDEFGGYSAWSRPAEIFYTGGNEFGVSFAPIWRNLETGSGAQRPPATPVLIEADGQSVEVIVAVHERLGDCEGTFEMTYDTFVHGLRTSMDEQSPFIIEGEEPRLVVTHDGVPNGTYTIVTKTDFVSTCTAGSYLGPLVVEVAISETSTSSSMAGPVPQVIDISGTWDLTITVVEVTGWCDDLGEYPVTLDIAQNGASLTATGFGDAELKGEISGNTVVLAGEKSEDKGITDSTMTLTVNDAGTRMDGLEEWSWSDGTNSCPIGESTVKATKAGT